MPNREAIFRKEIIQIGKLMYDKGLIVATDGNISVRLNKYLILITPSGFCKGMLEPHDIVRMNIVGKPITLQAKLKPSSEYQMHIAIYDKRPDINAIIHAHPVYAIALASASEKVKIKTQEWFLKLQELPKTVGQIAMIGDFLPGSKELAKAVAGAITKANAVLLENHGVVVGAEDLTQALYRLERVEFASKLYLLSQLFNKLSDSTTLSLV
jgi:L-fuculose-phosphate aldolase